MSDNIKIAYCMVGCMGGLQGKNHEKQSGSEIVLEHSSKSFFKNVYTDNIDVFIHSWDTHLHESYCKIYNPKKIKIEEQLKKIGIFYDKLIMGIGGGQRVIINDFKPDSDEPTAAHFCLKRNEGISSLNL